MKEKLLYTLLILFTLGIGFIAFLWNRKELKDIYDNHEIVD